MKEPKPESQTPTLLLLSAVFGDVHDLVLKNKKIGSAFTRQAHHVLVVILDPAVHRLTIHQLDADWFLLLTQRLQKSGFLESLFGGRRPAFLGGIGISLRTENHGAIVQRSDWRQPVVATVLGSGLEC